MTVNTEAEGSQRHLQSVPKGLDRDGYFADSKPIEVYRAGVLIKSYFAILYSLIYREFLCPNQGKES